MEGGLLSWCSIGTLEIPEGGTVKIAEYFKKLDSGVYEKASFDVLDEKFDGTYIILPERT